MRAAAVVIILSGVMALPPGAVLAQAETLRFATIHLEPYGFIGGDNAELGLAIVKSLVDRHHGEFDMKSRLGEGMTITPTLPSDGS